MLLATLEHHISSLLSLLPPLRSRVTATLARNCSDSLEVASIPRLFRNTRRPAPTLPSAYVTRILVPLDTGIQQDTAQGAVEDEWMRKVIDEVLVR